MAGRRGRVADALGAAPVGTQAAQSITRRAARFEELISGADSPVELVTVSSESLRSLLKRAKPDVAGVWAAEFVDLCRRTIHALTSENDELPRERSTTDA